MKLICLFAGFDNDSWSGSGSFNSWSSGGSSRSMNPPPLLPGLKRGSSGRGDEGNSRHCVLMRGLPYRAGESDIRKVSEQRTQTHPP